MTVADKKLANADNTQEPKTGLKIGIPKEVFSGERRVAATPDTAKTLQKMGFEVLIESKAGADATFSDQVYEQVGCQVISDAAQLWETADIILKVRAPQMHPTLNCHESELLHEGKTLISFIWPAQNEDLLKQLAERRSGIG